MAVFKSVPVDLPEAQPLAEMYGVILDLGWVTWFCQHFLGNRAHLDSFAAEGISTSAIVRYARCFATGVRPRLPREIINSLPERLQEIHARTLHLRNKYLAHSVNPYEKNRVTITVPEEPSSDWRPESVGPGQQRFAHPSDEFMQGLLDLAKAVKDAAQDWVRPEEEKVIAAVQAMAVEDLLRLEMEAAGPFDWKDAGRTRRRASTG